MAEAYLGDTGTEIILDCNVDITTATSVSITAQKPDGDTDTWSGTIDAGTRIKYSTQALDLNAIGVWQPMSFLVHGLTEALLLIF